MALDVFLDCFPPCIIEALSHLNPKHTNLAGLASQLSLEMDSLCLLHSGITAEPPRPPSLSIGVMLQTLVFMLLWQTLCLLSHLPSPLLGDFLAANMRVILSAARKSQNIF